MSRRVSGARVLVDVTLAIRLAIGSSVREDGRQSSSGASLHSPEALPLFRGEQLQEPCGPGVVRIPRTVLEPGRVAAALRPAAPHRADLGQHAGVLPLVVRGHRRQQSALLRGEVQDAGTSSSRSTSPPLTRHDRRRRRAARSPPEQSSDLALDLLPR